jgi:hypothetical protein
MGDHFQRRTVAPRLKGAGASSRCARMTTERVSTMNWVKDRSGAPNSRKMTATCKALNAERNDRREPPRAPARPRQEPMSGDEEDGRLVASCKFAARPGIAGSSPSDNGRKQERWPTRKDRHRHVPISRRPGCRIREIEMRALAPGRSMKPGRTRDPVLDPGSLQDHRGHGRRRARSSLPVDKHASKHGDDRTAPAASLYARASETVRYAIPCRRRR